MKCRSEECDTMTGAWDSSNICQSLDGVYEAWRENNRVPLRISEEGAALYERW